MKTADGARLVGVIIVATLDLGPALLGGGVVRVGVRVKAVDRATETLQGMDDLGHGEHSDILRRNRRQTHVMDGHRLGFPVLDVGNAVVEDLYRKHGE